MRWKGDRQSKNVEDRRSSSGGLSGGVIGGGGIGLLLIVLFSLFFSGGNIDLGSLLGSENSPTTTQQPTGTDEQKEFASVVFGHLEDYWNAEFKQPEYAQYQQSYENPTLVLYSGSVRSACGQASSAVGPFYCPGDQKVYLDLSFQEELSQRFGATGDFAMAYVIAHEVGHHIQYELGTSDKMERLRSRLSEKQYNRYSVALELQADYFAGCFTRYLANKTYQGQPILEVGDIDEAIQAANQIGDDTLQQEAQGYVVPDSFTHGTSEQRVDWFKRGYQYGDLKHGDTFSTYNLSL